MSKTKTYTLHPQYHGSSCLQHRLIRAAWAKGLTGIKITWYSSKNEKPGPGWWIEADQQPLRHIGFDIPSAEVRINRITVNGNMSYETRLP
jgi:hypothetical protein